MTRQRHTESNTTSMYTACPHCQGRGIVKNPRTVSVEVQRKLLGLIRRLRTDRKASGEIVIRIALHPINLDRIKLEDKEFFIDLEKSCNVRLLFKHDAAFHVETFKLMDETGNDFR